MTDRQNEEEKRKLRNALYDTRTIREVYPFVKQIIIAYKAEHRSAFGVNTMEHSAIHLPDHTNNYLIDCPNRECTSIGFNLKDEIWQMVRNHATEKVGEIRCEGSEAPAPLYQSCDATLIYTITIEYIPENNETDLFPMTSIYNFRNLMNEVKCLYVSEEESKKLHDEYAKIMNDKQNSSHGTWEKHGEYFRQFSIFSGEEVKTNVQNTVK